MDFRGGGSEERNIRVKSTCTCLPKWYFSIGGKKKPSDFQMQR